MTTEEQIMIILRQHWPESGGQSSHQLAEDDRRACAKSLIAGLGLQR